MKKLITLAISALMLVSLSATVFAEGNNQTAGNDQTLTQPTDIPVNVTVNEIDTPTIYKIDIKWTSLDFEYRHGNEGTWNPESHTYSGAVSSGWSVAGADSFGDSAKGEVTVTNHSNTDIQITATAPKVENLTGFDNVEVTIDSGTAHNGVLNTAVGITDPDAAENTVYTVTISKKPTTKNLDTPTKIANVKLTISDVQ